VKPRTAYKLWLILDAVTRDYPQLANELSAEQWMEVSRHVALLMYRCPDCRSYAADPLEHECPARPEPAIIV
jgi:hypothetical protein